MGESEETRSFSDKDRTGVGEIAKGQEMTRPRGNAKCEIDLGRSIDLDYTGTWVPKLDAAAGGIDNGKDRSSYQAGILCKHHVLSSPRTHW